MAMRHVCGASFIGSLGDVMKTFLTVCFMAALLLMHKQGADAALCALHVWGLDVVPSLFPYMVLCQSLTSSLSATGKAHPILPFLLGLLGGSPSASASLSVIAQYRSFDRQILRFLAALSGTISPMFFLGPVAAWFGSSSIAVALIICQYVGALLAGITVFLFSKAPASTVSPHNTAMRKNDDDPIARSVHAVLCVGGCIVFYSTAAECIRLFLPIRLPGVLECIHSLLEVSGGVCALAGAEIPLSLRMLLAAGFCGFGGISILSQNLLFLHPVGMQTRELAANACLRGMFSMMVMMGFLLFM